MTSDAQERVRLTAVGLTPATEIRICNAHFQQVGASGNAGRVQVELPVGMYRVTFREGDAIVDEVVSLLPGGAGPVTVRQKQPAPFASAMPLRRTRTSREWHEKSAQALSRSTPRGVESEGDAEMLIFVRDLGPPVEIELEDGFRESEHLKPGVQFRLELETQVSQRPAKLSELDPLDPTEGLTLNDRRGRLVTNVVSQAERARVGGLLTRLEPGAWRLRLDTGTGQTLELPVVCPPHRQTQVFLLCHDYGTGGGARRADLDSASVSLGPIGRPFDPGDGERRLTEVALKSLAARRRLRGLDMGAILHGKFVDPMLGLYGAHLLLLDDEPNRGTLDTVIRNTGRLLGARHPDLDAIRLARASLDGETPGPLSFGGPPMLAVSWDAVVAATRGDPEVVPAGSLSDLVSDRLIRHGPWVVWAWSPELDRPPASRSADPKAVARLAAALRTGAERLRALEPDALTPGERALGLSIEPSLDPFYRRLQELELVDEHRAEPSENDLSAALNLPVNSVRRIAADLLAKVARLTLG